jgi:hypothetical protein
VGTLNINYIDHSLCDITNFLVDLLSLVEA